MWGEKNNCTKKAMEGLMQCTNWEPWEKEGDAQ